MAVKFVTVTVVCPGLGPGASWYRTNPKVRAIKSSSRPRPPMSPLVKVATEQLRHGRRERAAVVQRGVWLW